MMALQGTRVLDLTRVMAGPLCTQTLGDLGAEIIKIENPDGGDDTRGWPPFEKGQSAYFVTLNRNKKSVAVDISTADGQEIVRRLAAQCDVFVENYRVGALEKYGLGYEHLRNLNPQLIYCSLSGYGRLSPMAERAGYDLVTQAESGIMSITGDPHGDPMRVGIAVVDIVAGHNACQAVLAALIYRSRTGKGQHIDIALLDSAIASLVNVGSGYLLTGKPPKRLGNANTSVVPYTIFKASDGYFLLAVGNDRQFRTLCDVIGLPHLPQDDKYASSVARVENQDTLLPLLANSFATKDTAYWVEKLDRASLVAGKVRSIGEALAAPEVVARGMICKLEHATAGRLKIVGSPLKMSESPVKAPSTLPGLGEHTLSVLSELLQFSAEDIASLASRAAIRCS